METEEEVGIVEELLAVGGALHVEPLPALRQGVEEGCLAALAHPEDDHAREVAVQLTQVWLNVAGEHCL